MLSPTAHASIQDLPLNALLFRTIDEKLPKPLRASERQPCISVSLERTNDRAGDLKQTQQIRLLFGLFGSRDRHWLHGNDVGCNGL